MPSTLQRAPGAAEVEAGVSNGIVPGSEDWLRVQQKFVRKFRKVLPEVKVARFYQLENKMDAEVEAQLAVVVPLVE